MRYGMVVLAGCLLLVLVSMGTGHTKPLDREHWEGLPFELKISYVAGVFDGWMVARVLEDAQLDAEGRAARRAPSRIRRLPDISKCLVRGIGVGETVALVDEYIANRPEERNLPIVMSLYILEVIEPCTK